MVEYQGSDAPVGQGWDAGGDASAATRGPRERHTEVSVSGAQGVQIGDHGTQVNNFYFGESHGTQPPARSIDGAAERVLSGVPSLLPRDVPAFTGRVAEMARLVNLSGGAAVVVTTIGGTAGVGKTALAVHAAHELLEQFPDGHLYADMRGYTEGQDPAEPDEVLQLFLRHLGVPVEEMPAGTEDRSGLLRQLLSSRRVLMVLDNVRTEGQVRPLLPGAGTTLVLVTSRSVLAGLECDERISLDVLSREEAATMLAALVGAGRAAAEPGALDRVASLCGMLPLALRIAGQLLVAHPAWPVAKLEGMLAGEQDRLARLGAGDLQVRAAFEVSYAQLAQPDARLFRLLGLHPSADFNVVAASALAGTEAAITGPALDRLAEAHLVTEGASGRYRMHDLLRLFALAACQPADDRDAAVTRLVTHYADVAGFVDACVDPQQRALMEPAVKENGLQLPSMRQALELFEAEKPCLMAVLSLAVERKWDAQVLLLNARMGNSLMLLRYLDDLLASREAALAAARRTGRTRTEAEALGNLGSVYQLLRRFEESIDCYQQDNAICRETGDRHGEAQTLGNLGTVYRQLWRSVESVDCYQQALVIFRETGDRYSEARTLGNLGVVYQELRRFEESIDCYQQALAVFRETGDRHSEGMALDNLALTHQGLRRYEEAAEFGCQALAVFRETGDRHSEGITLNNLAVSYQKLQRFDRAARYWREAAVAMRDAGDPQSAAHLEQEAAAAQTRHAQHVFGRRRTS